MAALNTASFGIPVNSLDALAGTTATNGTEFALPGNKAVTITWQTVFSSAPSAVNVVLQLSIDGTTYYTFDTSTDTAGEIRTVNTSAKFARIRLVSKTGGGTTTGIINTQPYYVVVVESGDIFDFTLTGLIADGTNGQVLTTDGAGTLSFSTVDLSLYLPLAGGTLTGNLLFTDNTLDIGASGATRPRTGYFGTSLIISSARNLITTSTNGLVTENSSAATVGVPVQISPRNLLSGRGWDTDDSVSRTVSFFTEVLPTSAATVGGTYKLGYIDPVSSAISYPFSFPSDGSFTTQGSLTSSSSIAAAAASSIFWTARSKIQSPADGQVNLNNNAVSAGVGFDVATDAILKVRTRAQTAYATIDALAYQVSGVAGVSGTITAASTVTVVNGIITAIV